MTAKSFRNAILQAIENNPYDPSIMHAVKVVAEGFKNVDGLLEYLWKYPDAFGWGTRMGLDHSSRKQSAVKVLTGKSWLELNR
jgi:hypothetical protein